MNMGIVRVWSCPMAGSGETDEPQNEHPWAVILDELFRLDLMETKSCEELGDGICLGIGDEERFLEDLASLMPMYQSESTLEIGA